MCAITDFELNYLINRNVKVSEMIVDGQIGFEMTDPFLDAGIKRSSTDLELQHEVELEETSLNFVSPKIFASSFEMDDGKDKKLQQQKSHISCTSTL